MPRFVNAAVFTIIIIMTLPVYAAKTIILIRHGEKPHNRSGQLTCKGLNRSLALPPVIVHRFGVPALIFASAPHQSHPGSSLRSVSTVTPLAIQVSLPVNIKYHASDVKRVANAIISSNKEVILVSWQHKNLIKLAKAIVTREGGKSNLVPDKWPKKDYDSIFVINIDEKKRTGKVTFSHQKEGLNDVSNECPSSY